MREFVHDGNRIIMNDDSTITVIRPDGTRIQTNKKGGTELDLARITRIGIANIVDLKNYLIMEREGLILHTIEMHGGGLLSLAYTADGRIENMTSRGVRVEVLADNSIIYHRQSN